MTMDCLEIAKKLNALNLWDMAMPYNWVIKARGTAVPYFCIVMKGERPEVKVRLLMLEGWQTMHDFVLVRQDKNFGFYTSPIEFTHYELVVTATDECCLFRHEPGYMPFAVPEKHHGLLAKLLWQCYGVMMRIENEHQLALKYVDKRAMFARIETADGVWEDSPVRIPDPQQHVEKVVFAKGDIKAATDLPFVKDDVLEVDFQMLPNVMTRETKPRCIYELTAKDVRSGEVIISSRASVMPEIGLRGLWESMPVQVLKGLIRHGKIPGEIRVCSGRVFRLLRPLGMELPFKLTLNG